MYFIKLLLSFLTLCLGTQARALRSLQVSTGTADLTAAGTVVIDSSIDAHVTDPVTNTIVALRGGGKEVKNFGQSIKMSLVVGQGVTVVSSILNTVTSLVIDVSSAVTQGLTSVALDITPGLLSTGYQIYSSATDGGKKTLAYSVSVFGVVTNALGLVVNDSKIAITNLSTKNYIYVESVSPVYIRSITFTKGSTI